MRIENLGDLNVLLLAAKHGSLTAASRELGVTPAAASAALKRMETQLGATLLERSTRSLRPTQQGRILLDYATRAFELLAEGESLATDDGGRLVGTIRLAAPSDLTRVTLLPWLSEFLRLHSELQLNLSVSDRPLDLVRDEVDVAIRYGVLADSRLIARQLAPAEPILCASPAYLAGHAALTRPEDLLQHNCLSFNRAGRRHRVWRFVRDGVWTEVRIDGDRSVDDASLARQWAVEGAGIIFKTNLDVRQDLASGALVQLLPEWHSEPYPLHALLPSGRFVSGRVRALLDFLAAKFKALR